VSLVKKETLISSSYGHIEDVSKGLSFFMQMLLDAAVKHDRGKISMIDWFYDDFKTGFKTHGWWDAHRQSTRHHLNYADGVPVDVNLVDVLEYVTDCVMAGMARSGSVYDITLDAAVLQKAFQNTVELLKKQVVVE
jgi:hypothetical protein